MDEVVNLVFRLDPVNVGGQGAPENNPFFRFDPPAPQPAPAPPPEPKAPEEPPPEAEGALMTGARRAAHAALPAASILPGMATGAGIGATIGTAIMPGPGTLIGTGIGGLAGLIGAPLATEKVQESALHAMG